MRRCVIVGGASIGDYRTVGAMLRQDDYVIYCDCGLRHMDGLGAEPDLIVGDFDSYSNPEMGTETIVLPCEKDDTDTVFAVKEAIKRGFEDFLLVGVVGERLDHTLGNVSILLMLDSTGKKGTIIDDYSEIEIVSDRCEKPCIIDDSYVYFSLINISGTARGVTIRGAKYPLENAEITCEYQYGVSNEVLPGCTAEVSVGEGRLLLVKVR
ncbi:MAG: thiamine diphosphokinase [Firmicutes bacterium]|nr:thiamine diphosphokinase [Bacillota bacterium]